MMNGMTTTPELPRPMFTPEEAAAIAANIEQAMRPLQEAVRQFEAAVTHANEQLSIQLTAFADALRQTKMSIRP